jgi:hypothetical protein
MSLQGLTKHLLNKAQVLAGLEHFQDNAGFSREAT